MSTFSGYDVAIYWHNGTTVAQIGQVRDIAGPGQQADAIDVTTREDGGNDSFTAGLRGGQDIGFDIVFDPDLVNHSGLYTDIANGTLGRVFLAAPTPLEEGWMMAALLTEFTPKAPLRDALTADVALAPAGPVAPIRYIVDEAGNYIATAAGNYVVG